MIAKHSVKLNGVWYKSGEEISPDLPKNVEEINKKVGFEKFDYSKTDINRMSTAELKELAKREEVENAEEMTGAELKKLLIEKYGL